MRRLLMFLLCIMIIFTFVFSYGNKSMQNEVVSYQYESDNKLSKSNDDLLDRVDRLEGLAEEYIMERQIDANATELCLQYLRKDRYNNEKWQGLMGPVDGTFVAYVEEHDPELKFSTHEVLYDLGTNRAIDFIHMAAVLNSYVRYGDTISLVVSNISTDYAGWAGDLLTFLEEIVNYRIENQPDAEALEDETEEEYEERIAKVQEYAISLLGTNKESTMSGSDILADFDAHNMYHDSTVNISNGLYDGLVKYYKNYSSTNNANNRFTVIQKKFGDTELSISNTLRPYLTDRITRLLFIPNAHYNVTEDDIKIVSTAFAKYVLGEIYLEIVPVLEDAVVGKEVKIKLIENHLDFGKVVVNPPELATAKISGEYVVVQPLEAGDAHITVSSLGGSASETYTLKIVNVEPKITKGLDSNYYFSINENETITLEAEGTNNIYTWYMSGSLNGDYKVLAESSSPTYVLTPTEEMDGKYLKCGVKNKGNEEVFSNVTVVFVSGSKIEEVVRKNDTLLIVLSIVLILVIILIIVYFKVIKGTAKDPFNKNKNVVYVTDVNNGYYPNNGMNQGMYPNQVNNQQGMYPNNQMMQDNNQYNQNNNNQNFF